MRPAEPSPWLKRMGVHVYTFGGGDCWHPEKHAGRHRPHPRTRRLVCTICHPPVGGGD